MPINALPSALALYVLAAFFELSGSFALWSVFRSGKSMLWLIPGMLALFAFAAILTRVDMSVAGRTYAAYGGIYVLGSMLWLWLIEGQMPDRLDIAGTVLIVAGTIVILLGRHSSR